MGLSILAEALARIEHKVDYLCRIAAKDAPQILTPLHFIGNECPTCKQSVDFQIDVQHQVVARRCGCTTGKVPSTMPLIPVSQPGVTNGNPSSDAQEYDDRAEKSHSRKTR